MIFNKADVPKSIKSKVIHITFKISIFLKGLNGFLEMIGGLLLVSLNPSMMNRLVTSLLQGELSEDPDDIIANLLLRSARQFSLNAKIFAVIYLLTHGIIKIFLVSSLWQRRLWAYPAAIVFFLLFIAYQIYRYSFTYSPWMIILTVLDIFVVILTWLEYGRLKRDELYFKES